MTTTKEKFEFGQGLKLLYFILSLCIFFTGIYFAYNTLFVQNNILKTTEDLTFITNNMSETFKGKYPFLDSQVIILGNILPYDLKIKETPKGYTIQNRFGGKIFFYNAYNTRTEREENSDYLGAYIILFTQLNKKECKILAKNSWRSHFPNFLGIEASYLSAQKSFNGVYNLRNHLLFDNLNEKYSSRDEGIISRRKLNTKEASSACGCFLNTCTIALKFK